MIFVFCTYFVIALVSIYFLYDRKLRQKDPLQPPGPWKLPILGHLPFLGAEPGKTLLKWKQIYGPIISIQLGSQPAVVLTDIKLIKEVFSKHATASRPPIPYFGEVSYGFKGLAVGMADTAIEQRHFILKTLKDLGAGRNEMGDNIMEEVIIFMKELEDEVNSMPEQSGPIRINARFTASVINSFWQIFMSQKFLRTESKFATMVKAAHNAMISSGVLGEMVIFLPWLANLIPGISGLTRRKSGFHKVYDIAEKEIQKHNKTRIRDQPRDFTDAYLDKVESTTDPNSTFHKIKNYQPITTGDIFLGALDTTSTSLEWLLIQLVRNPAVQNKVYEEVTRVTGYNSRLPNLSDRAQMPYTDAVVHELQRASTLVPLGVPHFAIDDIIVGQYRIRKGTMVVANLWGLHNDPEIWDEPNSFRPERFLELVDGELRIKRNIDNYLPFSHGKRVCVGRKQATDTIFLFTASLVQKFEFQCWKNLMPTTRTHHGLVVKPDKFVIKVIIREN